MTNFQRDDIVEYKRGKEWIRAQVFAVYGAGGKLSLFRVDANDRWLPNKRGVNVFVKNARKVPS